MKYLLSSIVIISLLAASTLANIEAQNYIRTKCNNSGCASIIKQSDHQFLISKDGKTYHLISCGNETHEANKN